jgi:hypothetical protein
MQAADLANFASKADLPELVKKTAIGRRSIPILGSNSLYQIRERCGNQRSN